MVGGEKSEDTGAYWQDCAAHVWAELETSIPQL